MSNPYQPLSLYHCYFDVLCRIFSFTFYGFCLHNRQKNECFNSRSFKNKFFFIYFFLSIYRFARERMSLFCVSDFQLEIDCIWNVLSSKSMDRQGHNSTERKKKHRKYLGIRYGGIKLVSTST